MTINMTANDIFKTVQFLLIATVLVLLVWSKPWDNTASNAEQRTISVVGETIIEAEPDEFVFNPYYEQEGSDKDVLREKVTKKANQVVDKLKELGVEEKNIKLDASSYDRWYWNNGEDGVLSVSLTINATGDELVQEIQDYLLTTGAEGQLTPRASFSKEKQKELDAQATEEASADARSKAEAQAILFGAKLGDVITISQQNENLFGYPQPFGLEASADVSARVESLPVLSGQNEYRQTINVVYELK